MKKLLIATALAGAMLAPQMALAANDSVTFAQRLEPPGLDPRTGAAAAISLTTLYNVYEGLTRVDEKSMVHPALAESWTISDDGLTYTFKLVEGAKFHDGTDFDSSDVKYTFEANAAEDSQNKRKDRFTNMESIETPDANTVVIKLKERRPDLLEQLGESTAVIVDPASDATNETMPVGTGPYKFDTWTKGDSLKLTAADTYRDKDDVAIKKVTFRFIGDGSARLAALLTGDVDSADIPNELIGNDALKADFDILVGNTNGETILSTNNANEALSKLKVRQAIAHAINRQEIIDGAMFGFGTPIGSHFAPHHPDYIDLTGTYPYDPEKSKQLLAEAGYPDGLELSLKLPPVDDYARKGGQIVASQLEKAGFKIKIENVDWPKWLDEVYKKKNYDLSIVSHVEPMDIGIYAREGYYFNYNNTKFNEVVAAAESAASAAERTELLQTAQKMLAEDAVNGYLFQLPRVIVVRKGLNGVWQDIPFFVTDVARMSWSE
ncbi:ABC transporter substrate-binding protein [uncultured Sneathiella sp.]|jgi:peptide/nickel transport system substrate-binding protein|uniref:ABC transporter substrate-binding protein n=1 Tax=uncultured Sneathiella sp. TaxID=879315 RepID=UPI0030D88FA9|tara:strand:+ start:23550 stop:25028 length:1479 start_codon:yes stop_codon:yes gene_type:complete